MERLDLGSGAPLSATRIRRGLVDGAPDWLRRDPAGIVLIALRRNVYGDVCGTSTRIRKLEARTGRDLWEPIDICGPAGLEMDFEGHFFIHGYDFASGRSVLEKRVRDTGAFPSGRPP